MDIKIVRAEKEDAKRIAEVYNASFYSDFVKYGECPGYGKTEESIIAGMEKNRVYKILADDVLVGAVSVREEKPDHYYLGGICVEPEHAGQGIGQQAMRFLDREFSDAVHWALETPTDKLQNHHFYKKFGYGVTKEYLDGSVPISYFERQCPPYFL